jgi:ribonucleoside-diphosphate reductase alpha chain
MAKSLIDYIFRWLASRFLDAEDQEAVGIVRRDPLPAAEISPAAGPPMVAPVQASSAQEVRMDVQIGANGNGAPAQKLTFVVNADAPACSECGSITVRSGACYKCMNCGATTGCS